MSDIILQLRDEQRYGIFKANSSIGIVKIEICTYGWGDLITLHYDNNICQVDTIEDDDYYIEDDESIQIYCDGNIHGWVTINKPFIRCLKRFKWRRG